MELPGVEGHTEVANTLLAGGEDLRRPFVERDLHAEEPHVDELLANPPELAAEHVDVEVPARFEVADRQ